MTQPNQVPVGQLLLAEGLITPEQLEAALQRQANEGGKTFENLIALGHLSKDDLHGFLSRQPGVAAIDLKNYRIEGDLVALLPKELVLRELVLPIDKLGKLLSVAMACPIDRDTIAQVEQLTGLRVKAMLCRLDDIHAAVTRYYPDRSAPGPRVATFEHLGLGAGTAAPATGSADLAGMLGDVQVLPVLDSSRKQLAALAGDSAARAKAALEILAGDAGFAATALRLANGQIFSLPGEIDTLAMALALAGPTALAKAAELAPVPSPAMAPFATALGARALKTGILASRLAEASGQLSAPLAFTAGTLLEVGRLVLCQLRPDRYLQDCSSAWGPDLAVLERKAFGVTHAQAAGTVLARWRLPPAIVEPVAGYLDSADKQLKGMSAVLQLASLHVNGGDSAGARELIATAGVTGAAAEKILV